MHVRYRPEASNSRAANSQLNWKLALSSAIMWFNKLSLYIQVVLSILFFVFSCVCNKNRLLGLQWGVGHAQTQQSIVQLLCIVVFRFIENIREFCNVLRLLTCARLARHLKYCLASLSTVQRNINSQIISNMLLVLKVFSNDHVFAVVYSL